METNKRSYTWTRALLHVSWAVCKNSNTSVLRQKKQCLYAARSDGESQERTEDKLRLYDMVDDWSAILNIAVPRYHRDREGDENENSEWKSNNREK